MQKNNNFNNETLHQFFIPESMGKKLKGHLSMSLVRKFRKFFIVKRLFFWVCPKKIKNNLWGIQKARIEIYEQYKTKITRSSKWSGHRGDPRGFAWDPWNMIMDSRF